MGKNCVYKHPGTAQGQLVNHPEPKAKAKAKTKAKAKAKGEQGSGGVALDELQDDAQQQAVE